MKQLTINVSASGNVVIEADGFEGVGCAEASEKIEIALGGGVSRKEKPEFNMPAQNTAQQIKSSF